MIIVKPCKTGQEDRIAKVVADALREHDIEASVEFTNRMWTGRQDDEARPEDHSEV